VPRRIASAALLLVVIVLVGCGSATHTTSTVPASAPAVTTQSQATTETAAKVREAAETKSKEELEKKSKEAQNKAALQRIELEGKVRAERLCKLYREYQQAPESEQRRILELMAQIAPGVANRGNFGEPTGFNETSLKVQLSGSECEPGGYEPSG